MSKGPKASPIIRQFAYEQGIPEEELASLPGSGKNGSLTKSDVLEWKARRAQANEPEVNFGDEDLGDPFAPAEEGDEEPMPVMDPDAEAASDGLKIELSDEDGREEPGGNPWLDAVEDSERALEDSRRGVVEETVVVRKLAKVNPMRHKRWKPDRYRLARKRPGWKCRFVHKANVQRYRGEGYSIATSRHYSWDGRNVGAQLSRGAEKTAVVVNNCVLMEIPDEVAAARKAYYRNMSEANLVSPTSQAVASGELKRMGHFGKIKQRPKIENIERTTKTGEGFW